MRVVFGVDLTYFYWSCAAGIALAVLYDILRIKRRLIHTPDFLVNIEDIICLAVFGVVIIYTAYEKNNGNLRLYGIGVTVMMFAVYRLVVGNAAVHFLSFLFLKTAGFIKKALNFLTAPFRFVYVKAVRPVFSAATKRAAERRAASPDNAPNEPSRRENP